MKEKHMKIIEKLKAHKKIVIGSIGGIIAVFLIILIAVISGKQENVMPSETEKNTKADNDSTEVIQYIFSDGDMSRGEWLKLFSEKFGMYNYVTEEPFFGDVPADSELFQYIQTCVENNVLEDSEKLYIDEKISLREAFTQLGRTYGEDYISRRAGKEIPENNDYLEYILSIDDIKQYQDAMDRGFNEETAEAILDITWKNYMSREWENDVNIVYAKGVIDLSDVTEYTYDGNTVNIKTNEKIEQGKIIILGATEEWETGLALKVNEIISSDGKYIVQAEIPELNEVVESLYVEMNELVDFENFIPEEGVTIIEDTEAANYVSDLYNSRLNTINILNYEFNKNLNGTVIKLEVNLSDEKIKISPQYEKYGIKAELTDVNPNYYFSEEGKLSSKYEKGIDIKGSIELSDLILKGSVGYKNNKVRFDIDTGFSVKTGLKVEGNVKGKSFLLGKASIKLASGVWAEMKIYLKVDFDGSISVSASITDTCNIKKEYNGGINVNAKSDFNNSTKIEASMEAKFGPDFVIKFLAAPIVDVYGYIGLKSQAKWNVNDPLKITVESYAPVIEAGVGEDSGTVLNALGVKAKIKVMDIEKAMLKSPLISTITFNLFDGRVTVGEENTTEGQNVENSGVENTTSKTPSGDNTETPDNNQNSNASNVTIVASGNRWKLDSEGTFTYFGEGNMDEAGYLEWWEYLGDIKKIVIEDGVTSIERIARDPVQEALGIPHCTVEKILIPNSVTSIGDHAFECCYRLTSITIPSSVTSIGYYAFGRCGLKSITIPSGVTSIGDSTFSGCISLTSIIIPSGVTSIGDGAFSDCSSLTGITIPSGVTSIGSSAFKGTPWLKTKQNENPLVIVNGILIDGSKASGEVKIPNSVKSIGDSAFEYCNSLTNITIPSSVTSIGDRAFSSCSSLTSITISNGVTSIGQNAFQFCNNLTSITIPNSVTSIGVGAFSYCNSLTSITIPSSVTSIEVATFYQCSNLTSITIPNSVKSIGEDAFRYCSSSLTIYGNSGSKAEEYANENGIEFIAIQ